MDLIEDMSATKLEVLTSNQYQSAKQFRSFTSEPLLKQFSSAASLPVHPSAHQDYTPQRKPIKTLSMKLDPMKVNPFTNVKPTEMNLSLEEEAWLGKNIVTSKSKNFSKQTVIEKMERRENDCYQKPHPENVLHPIQDEETVHTTLKDKAKELFDKIEAREKLLRQRLCDVSLRSSSANSECTSSSVVIGPEQFTHWTIPAVKNGKPEEAVVSSDSSETKHTVFSLIDDDWLHDMLRNELGLNTS